MPKITFKTLGLLAIFSFFAMHINGYINFVTNFLVILSYNTRLALSFIITLILYFIATYLLAKMDGYITTGKLKFDKKAIKQTKIFFNRQVFSSSLFKRRKRAVFTKIEKNKIGIYLSRLK